jgi:RNase P subunit RPR2
MGCRELLNKEKQWRVKTRYERDVVWQCTGGNCEPDYRYCVVVSLEVSPFAMFQRFRSRSVLNGAKGDGEIEN